MSHVDTSFYLAQKLAQLQKSGAKTSTGANYTTVQEVAAAFANAGLTAAQHFTQFGQFEGLSPNANFDVAQYYGFKANQLNATNVAKPGGGAWTALDVELNFIQSKISAWNHFVQFGFKEGVNPSNAFDLEAYYASKAANLNSKGSTNAGAAWTGATVKAFFISNNIEPISHFIDFGRTEGVTVTAVPANQQVAGGSNASTGNTNTNPGQTFTLVAGADNITGTTGDDTINAIVDTNTAANTTLSAADRIAVGTSGTDTLFITTVGAVGNLLNGADVTGVDVVSVRNTNATGGNVATLTTAAGLTGVNVVRGSGDVTVTANLAQGAALGIDATTGGVINVTHAAAATSATINVSNAATSGAVTVNGTGLTSATINSTAGANTLGGVALAAGVNSVTVNATSNVTTGAITGVAANTTLTVSGAGTANVNTLAANVSTVNAAANTGGVTATLNAATGIKVTGGSGNDVITTGAVLVTGADVNAGAGTADRLVVANTTHLTAATGALYKGFELVEASDNTVVDVTFLAANNTITGVRINDAGNATQVTGLSAAQAANVSILAANATGAITIGLTGAANGGQIDTVKAAVTTTTAAGAAQNADLSGIVLTGIEKLEIAGTGTVAATTGKIDFTAAAATALDSVKFANAGAGNTVNVNAAAGTNLSVDASASTGDVTITATNYNTTTGATLRGGSSFDVLLGSVRSDTIVGGAGNDVISGVSTGAVTKGTATAIGSVAAAIADSTAADVLTGGDGRDMFAIGKGAVAVASSITDLNLGGNSAATGVDGLTFDLATAGGTTAPTIVTLSAAQQTTVSAAANIAAAADAVANIANVVNNVVQFTFGADTYIFANGVAGGTTFAAAEDVLVKVTGVTGTLDVSDITIV